MMQRVYNFSPGPSMLPLPVLEKAGAQITNANGSGQSVMEMSHRAKDFERIIKQTEDRLRELLDIPANYVVLFLQGGAMLQFSMVPINLAGVEAGAARKRASFIDSGIWAAKAADEAKKYLDGYVAASSKDCAYCRIPDAPPPREGDVYYHICLNNTIVGTKWRELPAAGAVPLVADVSSCILSEPMDISRFGLVYAGAQKNLGPAGCAVVIIREDLIGRAPDWTPAMLRYDIHAQEKSMFNTPPCWSIYMIGLVLEWAASLGGLKQMARLNQAKADMLYHCLERSPVFRSPVDPQYRSLMNITFVVRDHLAAKKAALEQRFLSEAAQAGLINLAGHRLVGGFRASMYNAMPEEGAAALVSFIEKFGESV